MPRTYSSYESCFNVTLNALLQAAKVNAKRTGEPVDPAKLEVEAHQKASVAWYRQNNPVTPKEQDEWAALAEELTGNYLAQDPFDTPAARGQLKAIVQIEVEMERQRLALAAAKPGTRAADSMVDGLRKLAETHRSLVQASGLDRKSAEDQKRNASPMEKWGEQVGRFAAFMKKRLAEFPTEAETVESERDLRELARYKLGWDFAIIDALMANTKRVNGLEATVDQYE